MAKTDHNDPGEVLPLTSLRFFAAFYVVLFHTVRTPFGFLANGNWLSRLVGTGYISVSFFFTLSGYILALVYLRRGRSVDRGRFWQARFARIYPVFLFTLVLDFPYSVFESASRLGLYPALEKISAGFVLNCLMLQAWHPGWRVIDQPNWSLSVETVFYLLFPLIGLGLWQMRTRKFFALCAGGYAVSVAASVFAIHRHVDPNAVMFNPLLHVHEFVAGVLICVMQARLSGQAVKRIARLAPWLLVGSLALFLGIVAVENQMPSILLHNGLLVPLYGVVILAASSGGWGVAWALSRDWMVTLGKASYALYLIHVPLWHLVLLGHWENSRALYPVYLLATLGSSVLVYYRIEEPARKALKSWPPRAMRDRVSQT
ncbi:MAG TPA: acyltransferase [Terriglobales bacterium]|nr:acyltransferase [Terriglobales bacterium]